MSEITLKKGKPSAALRSSLDEYYSKIPGVDRAYVDTRWEQWKQGGSIMTYLVKKDADTVGWILYNRATSAVEEIFVKESKGQAGIRTQAINALIALESLVSAEVAEEDKEKLRWLAEYGFRPTRKIKAHGRSLVKMELSTVVFLPESERI